MTKFKGPIGWVARTVADAWSPRPKTWSGLVLATVSLLGGLYLAYFVIRG